MSDDKSRAENAETQASDEQLDDLDVAEGDAKDVKGGLNSDMRPTYDLKAAKK